MSMIIIIPQTYNTHYQSINMSFSTTFLRTLARPGPSRLPFLAHRSYAARAALIPGTRAQLPVPSIPSFLDSNAIEQWQDSLWQRLESELEGQSPNSSTPKS